MPIIGNPEGSKISGTRLHCMRIGDPGQVDTAIPYVIAANRGGMLLASLTRMFPRFVLVLAAAVALLALPKAASAQGYFSNYGSGALVWSPSMQNTVTTVTQNGVTFIKITPRPPRPQHDIRMDLHLLKAARIAEANALPRSTMRCWRYVKQALLQAGAVAEYPATNYACQAGDELTSHYGFVRLAIHDPYRAPVGSVLVYSGGGAGHVEIRTEHGFASDYRSAWACRYRLIGVYAKLSA